MTVVWAYGEGPDAHPHTQMAVTTINFVVNYDSREMYRWQYIKIIKENWESLQIQVYITNWDMLFG